jgi:hypothetical protein
VCVLDKRPEPTWNLHLCRGRPPSYPYTSVREKGTCARVSYKRDQVKTPSSLILVQNASVLTQSFTAQWNLHAPPYVKINPEGQQQL